VLGHRIRADLKFFFLGGGRRRTDSKQTWVEKHMTAANCLCNYIWLLAASSADPHRGSAPGLRWGSSVPQTHCAHPDFRAWLVKPNERLSTWVLLAPIQKCRSYASSSLDGSGLYVYQHGIPANMNRTVHLYSTLDSSLF